MFLAGEGMVDLDIYKANKAAQTYEERLYVAKNNRTGDYCVWRKMARPSPDVPIFGWREGATPTPDEIQKKLYEMDKLRDANWFSDMERRNNLRLASLRKANEDILHDGVERVGHILMRTGDGPEHKPVRNAKQKPGRWS